MKRCARCGQTKALDEFYLDRQARDGRASYCKDCRRQQQREYQGPRYRNDPAFRERQQASFRAANGRARTASGLTKDERDALVAAAEGCRICGSVDRLVVDHDHDTGEIRGVICTPCNIGLGLFGDDPDRLVAAAAYLLASNGLTCIAP